MGKWTKLRNELPAYKLPDKDYQLKVNEEKARILGLADKQRPTRADAERANAAFLGDTMVKARRAKDKLEDKLYDVNLTIEALTQLLRDRMEGEEQEGIELRSGLSLRLKDDVYPMIKDTKKFYRWIKATGQVALLSIHFKRFQAVVKEALEQGRAVPPGTEVFIKTTVTVHGLKGVKANVED
jgi:hypothetical protein